MPIPGTWNWFYSWGCNGSYSQATVTLNADGTFSDNFGESGHWDSVGGYFVLSFNGLPTVYGGSVQGSAMVGAMSFFDGSNGCWYMIETSASLTAAKAEKGARRPSGKK